MRPRISGNTVAANPWSAPNFFGYARKIVPPEEASDLIVIFALIPESVAAAKEEVLPSPLSRPLVIANAQFVQRWQAVAFTFERARLSKIDRRPDQPAAP